MISPLTDIPDHLLAEILLRLPAPDDLARASAACVSFRRLVTDRSFVRRFRRFHAPPFLGFLDHDGFHPAQPPHPSASSAHALTLAADFSFSFLPSHCRWTVQDIRDGRVLLRRPPERPKLLVSTELVLCDPLHGLYVLLPPVPDDLADSPDNQGPMPQCKSFLVPLSEEESEAEETAFKVICILHCKIKLSAFLFSSSTGQWRAVASKAWSDLFLSSVQSAVLPRVYWYTKRHYAYGCFYWDWLIFSSKTLLVLDTRKMEFSMANLPPGEWSNHGLAIIEAGEGRFGMFGFRGGTSAAGLTYIIEQNKAESPRQPQMEKRISLEPGYQYDIKDATERYLLLRRTQASYPENPLTEYFSVDIKTLKLQRVCEGAKMYEKHIYTNFPPSLLSSPTI